MKQRTDLSDGGNNLTSRISRTEFERSLSNVIDNAVDACVTGGRVQIPSVMELRLNRVLETRDHGLSQI